jgi:hypothetical protein
LELRQQTPKPEVSVSTRWLYHAFGIRAYDDVRTDFKT